MSVVKKCHREERRPGGNRYAHAHPRTGRRTGASPAAADSRVRAVAERPEIQQLRRLARVDPEFAREGISAVGASAVVQEAIGNTAEDLHQAEDEIARWAVAESELRSMLRGVATANLLRRHRVALALLQAYNVSRQLVRQEEHAQLRPHVDRMFRVRKFDRRRGKTAADPAPQPAAAS